MCVPKTTKIILTQEKEALIDVKDSKLVNQHKWYVHKPWNWYAMTNVDKNGKRN